MTSEQRGLCEVGAGVFAYLQVGGWGYSNAGLVTSAGSSLLVDTLYDLKLTRVMLDEMQRRTPAQRIDSVVNTHANGDHCWGNQLVGSAKIISSRAAAEEMLELSPRLMHTMVQAARAIVRLGPLAKLPLSLLGRLRVPRVRALAEAAPFIVEIFGGFDFGAISLRAPDTTFEDRLVLQVGDKQVHLIEVGPAHTKGDVIVYVPEDRVVFTGDILFMGSHPIVWAGPIDNWIRACDLILELEVDRVVPGHGPLTDKQGVKSTRDYWQRLQQVAEQASAAGASEQHILRELEGQQSWREAERLVANVEVALRELANVRTPRDPVDVMASMARYAGRGA
ncbi:MAG: MBL fold metallo-hydrolase [Myxococcales bacterium]